MKLRILPLAAALFVASSVHAQDGAVEDLAAVRPGDHARYLELRGPILAAEGAKAALEALSQGDWTEETWTLRAVSAALALRLGHPDLAAAVDRPLGVDPAHYAKFRKPAPMVEPELARLDASAWPLLIERYRWLLAERPYSEGEAGEAERRCLRAALISVIGRAGDPRAQYFLRALLDDGAAPLDDRRHAALALGRCAQGQGLEVLAARLSDRDLPSEIREACARGVGQVYSLSSLEILKSVLTDEDAAVRRSAISGLGQLGNAWVWDALARQGKGEAEEAVRTGCASALVEALAQWPGEAEAVSTALCLTAWPGSAEALRPMLDSAKPELRTAAERVLPLLEKAIERQGN